MSGGCKCGTKLIPVKRNLKIEETVVVFWYVIAGLVHYRTSITLRRVRVRHRRRSGWTSGGTHGERRRWLRAEWGGYGEGCPLSSRLRGLGERRELLQRGPGRAPAKNGFWRILKATERSFLYLYDKIWAGGQFALASPAPNSGGTCPSCPPGDLRPWG